MSNTKQVDELMEQAQIFASSWSLVGGFFDKGQMLSQAEEVKAELRQMLEAALPAKAFKDLPLSESALSSEERAKWINVLDPLLKYAGAPGDWGYGSKLGQLIQVLTRARAEIAQGDKA